MRSNKGVILFDDAESAQQAQQKLNGNELNSKKLTLTVINYLDYSNFKNGKSYKPGAQVVP